MQVDSQLGRTSGCMTLGKFPPVWTQFPPLYSEKVPFNAIDIHTPLLW